MSSTVSSVDPNAYYTPPAPAAKSELNMETFMKLMTAQMANQKPLDPMKDSDFFSQLSQLGQVQGINNLQNQSKVSQAQSLMGQTVTALNPNGATDLVHGQTVTGVATGLTIVNGVYSLTLKLADGTTSSVSMDSIQSVSPTQKVSDYAYLVGKQVKGLNGTTNISGTATGVESSGGTMMVDVKTAGGQTLQLPVDGIQSVGQ